ncbi:hypothetical protein TBR22_A23240 [Luteitalea sp. TBR-22]|uniref:glycosyl hydrolase family 8 n=1 Tax=Luteitalea sp. TBR-22 TaxID=2802971 RepID=UPI001AFA4BBA|nr:glycosyl hydrolase family 8 [Luteitalea sp. TBR-22]BCS33098.1 hypothetical protein TBR22_A23240 [Luteitalea sp. TBR-22]
MTLARPAAVLLILVIATAAGCRPGGPPRTPDARLGALWSSFLGRYVRPSGAVVDPLRDGQVSSEAQSYALVRAVWMRDRATFRRVLAWTEAHLDRPDGLRSWLWDPATGRVRDANTATDGDIEIAWALALASIVFDEPAYATRAATLVRAIRTQTGIPVGDAWFPSAGNWARRERIVNLSYFYPYAFAWFARLDPQGRWEEATAVGYRLLARSLASDPGALPVDFNIVSPDGELSALPEGHMLGRTFSFDSIRIVWRVDLACRLQADRRACELAATLARRLDGILARDGRFVTSYDASGRPLTRETSLSFPAAFLPAMTRVVPERARQWRDTDLGDDALDVLMRADDRYYDANWAWFGLAAADGFIERRTPALGALRAPAR